MFVSDAVGPVSGSVWGPLLSARCAMRSMRSRVDTTVRAACPSRRPLLPVL